jgi:hypothetical protein
MLKGMAGLTKTKRPVRFSDTAGPCNHLLPPDERPAGVQFHRYIRGQLYRAPPAPRQTGKTMFPLGGKTFISFPRQLRGSFTTRGPGVFPVSTTFPHLLLMAFLRRVLNGGESAKNGAVTALRG